MEKNTLILNDNKYWRPSLTPGFRVISLCQTVRRRLPLLMARHNSNNWSSQRRVTKALVEFLTFASRCWNKIPLTKMHHIRKHVQTRFARVHVTSRRGTCYNERDIYFLLWSMKIMCWIRSQNWKAIHGFTVLTIICYMGYQTEMAFGDGVRDKGISTGASSRGLLR